MTLIDGLLIATLVVFVLAWWIRRTPARRMVLIASAFTAGGLSVAGYFDNRWQDAAGAVIALVLLTVLGITVIKNRITRTDRIGGVPFISGLCIAALAALPVVAILAFPVWPLPKPSGQYAVGVRAFELADVSRPGVFSAKPNEPRRLLIRVWYPAGDTSGHETAPYFSAAETKSTARSLGGLLGFPEFFTYVSHVKTNSYIDAPIAPGVADLPVVFYSHGYTSFLGQNTVLMEHLASHGYVVFSIQHTYDSASTAFLNGDVADMDAALGQTTEDAKSARPLLEEAMAGATLDARLEGALAYQESLARVGDRVVAKSTPTWVADRLFVHNTLQTAPPASVAEIAAAGNFSRVGEIGMSMGGAISGEICMIDRRCAAGVNLDGSNLPFTAFDADIPAPFLMFHSDLSVNYRLTKKAPPAGTPRSFNEFSYERIANAGARSDIYRVQLNGVLHLGLSDFTHFMIPPLRDSILGGGPENIIIGAQNDFVLGFLDKHLRAVSNDFPAKQLGDYTDWVLPTPNADLRAWWAAKPEIERTALEARINALKPVYPPTLLVDR